MPHRGAIIVIIKLSFINIIFSFKTTTDYLNRTIFTILNYIPYHITPRPL